MTRAREDLKTINPTPAPLPGSSMENPFADLLARKVLDPARSAVAQSGLSKMSAVPGPQPQTAREGSKLEHRTRESSDRLAAIARGEKVETDTHEALAGESPVLETLNFNFWYGTNHALHDVTMKIPTGKITAIIGPSGCGKSTLLRSINRLNDLLENVRYEGDILLNGDSIYGKGVDVIELRKRMGMVFQKSNPFPMSLYENVVYSLRVDGERKKQVLDEVVERSLKGSALWDEVAGRLDQNALGLSGGQQQRLCIARAIAGEPEVLLMDEPCSALDPLATSKIEELMQELRGTYSIVIVTHNMQQAARVSDYTAFMYLGRLIEYGATPDIFLNPHLPETGDYVTGRFG